MTSRIGSGIVVLALSAMPAIPLSGCDAARKLIAPRLDKPKIGTRAGMHAALEPATEVPSARGLGCDVAFKNVPSSSTLVVKWFQYDGEDKVQANAPKDDTKEHVEVISGTGSFQSFLETPNGAPFPEAIYVCEFTVKSSRTFDGNVQSARIKIGKGVGAPSKDKDDDDEPPKPPGSSSEKPSEKPPEKPSEKPSAKPEEKKAK